MSFADLIEAADRIVIDAFGDKDGDGEPVTVTVTPTVGDPVPVAGVFDVQYVLAKGTAEAGVETLGPAVFFRLSDLPVDPEDDEDLTLTIRGDDYRITECRPDGLGGIVLAVRRIG